MLKNIVITLAGKILYNNGRFFFGIHWTSEVNTDGI